MTGDPAYDIDLRDVRTCEDIDELLDTRADALVAINDIALQIQADKLLPIRDPKWLHRAQGAMRFKMRLARTATTRLLEIAPEELAEEQANDPQESPFALNDRIAALEAELKQQTERVVAQQTLINGLRETIAESGPDARALKAETHRLSLEAAERARAQKLEAQRIRDENAERRFVDAARRVLTQDQYQDIWRAAGIDEKPKLAVVS